MILCCPIRNGRYIQRIQGSTFSYHKDIQNQVLTAGCLTEAIRFDS